MPPKPTDDASPLLPGPPASLRRVERAVADLRRGTPVIVSDPDTQQAAIVLAAETAGPVGDGSEADTMTLLARLSGSRPSLAMTGERAEVLRLGRAAQGPRSLTLNPKSDPDLIQAMLDPYAGPDALSGKSLTTLVEPKDGVAAAALSLTKRARLWPTVLFARVDVDDTIALERRALEDGLVSLSLEDVRRAPAWDALRLEKVAEARVPLADIEEVRLISFRPPDGGAEHVAILVGDVEASAAAGGPILTRLHSECFTGDLLGSLRCDCGEQLRGALKAMAVEGTGVLLYLAQEGRDIGLVNKLRAYALQDRGMDTVDANLYLGFASDERDFRPAAAMLRLLGVETIRLLTNNPSKIEGLESLGITVQERVPLSVDANPHNAGYLATKAAKSGHQL